MNHKVVDGQDVVVVRLAHAVWLPKVTHRPHALTMVDGLVKRGVDVLVVGQLPTIHVALKSSVFRATISFLAVVKRSWSISALLCLTRLFLV